eukprot:IDg23111t1
MAANRCTISKPIPHSPLVCSSREVVMCAHVCAVTLGVTPNRVLYRDSAVIRALVKGLRKSSCARVTKNSALASIVVIHSKQYYYTSTIWTKFYR